MTRATDGKSAEDLAAAYLVARGLTLLERNYHCRMGEIDLILRDRDTLVFAEVRLRKHADFGGAAASITPSKQRRVLAAARYYLSGRTERPCRFDVLVLERLSDDAIEWIKDAFGE
jgi:putative endonuclease